MRVVILGAGDVGSYLSAALSASGDEVIVVDSDAGALTSAEEGADALGVQGDCTHRSVLSAARVASADLVVAVTGSDHTNLVGAALARQLGAQCTIARVDDPGFYDQMAGVERGVLGTTALLCASRLVTEELLRKVLRIEASFASNFCDGRLQIAAAPISPTGRWMGQPAARIKLRPGVSLVAIRRDSVLRSVADIGHLEADDELLLSGPPERVLGAFRDLSDHGPRRAVIVGGGDVGTQLATVLGQVESRVQVVEVRRDRCEYLSRQLDKVNVIHADGTSISHLKDERVGNADYVLSVTRRDEVNLMVSLLVRELGAASALTLVHRPGYAEAYGHLGLTATAGTHQVIERAVSALIPRDGVLVEHGLPDSGYSLFEFRIPAQGRPWTAANLLVGQDAFLAGVFRGTGCLAPALDLPLMEDDRIVVAAPRGARDVLARAVRRTAEAKR